jgi:C-terminal processing protease CtpA/Prc
MNRLVATLALISAFSVTAGAAEKAWYGFHIKPETSGFVLNPIVQSVPIDRIAPNSPASGQDIRVGDEIIEADGKAVRGARALELLALMNKKPGDRLRLVLRRPNGETYRAEMVAITKPPKAKPTDRSSS